MCQTLITYFSCGCLAENFSLPCVKPTAECVRLSKTCIVERLQESCPKHPVYHNHPAFRAEKVTDKFDWTVKPKKFVLDPIADTTDKMRRINVMDVPVYDNGRGYTGSPAPSKKGAQLAVSKSYPKSTSRTAAASAVKSVHPQKAQGAPSRSTRVPSSKAGHSYSNPKLTPAPLTVTKKKAVVTMLGNVSPAPGMSKYADRPLPPPPTSQDVRTLRRKQSRNQLLATRADEILSSAQKGHTTKAPALLASKPKIFAGHDVVDYHLNEGRVKKFDPNASTLHSMATHSSALARHNQEVSRKRLDAARRAVGKHGSKKCYDTKEFRALTREELRIIQLEIADGKLGKTCGLSGSSRGGESKKSHKTCTVM